MKAIHRKTIFIPFVLLMVSVAVEPAAQESFPAKVRKIPAYLKGAELNTARLYREMLPTVVTIFTKREVYRPEDMAQQQGIGSGVLVSNDCHVLTAAHVVDGAEEIIVKTTDGERREAELLFSEAGADIALIKLVKPDTSLKHAKLGDSDELVVGQMAFAIGSPYGLENSFSVGHISGFREFDRLYDGTIRAEFIQTDAAINSGNSGGPIFNSQGEVIGIASRILSVSGGSQGLGFVVAINTAKQLMALEDRLWLGIEAIFLTKEMVNRLLNRDLEGGLLVERVAKGSPADRAGLRGGMIAGHILGRDFLLGGDLIIELGSVNTCRSECLVDVRKHVVGIDRIPVKLLRDGKVIELIIDVSSSRRNFLKK
jgi:serine protease Do